MESIKTEDSKISSVEILSGDDKKQQVVRGSDILYSALQDSSRSHYLKLNDMLYKFDQGETGQQTLDLNEKSALFNDCKTQGLSNMQAATIATIVRQVKENLSTDAAAAATPAEPAPEDAKPKRGRPKKSAASKSTSTKSSSYQVADICNQF